MSDANRVGLSAVKESVWGTTPASALEVIRFNSESLNANIENITSQELRSDGQIADLVQVGADSGGGVEFELSYGGSSNINDEIMAGVLFSSWIGVGDGIATITSGTTVGNLDFVTSGSTLTLGSSVTHNIIEGIWIKIAGAASGNNTYHFVTDVTGNVITVQTAFATDETLDETDAAIISGEYLINGTTQSSFTIERVHADLTTTFFAWTGMVPGSMALNFTNKQIVTGSYTFMGKLPATGVATVGTGAQTAAGTNPIMSASSNVGQIMEGSTLTALSSTYIQSLTLNVSKNLRAKEGIGTLGPVGVGSGTFNVTGSMSLYFADTTMYAKFVAAMATGISWKVEDTDGNAYVFTMPNIKFSQDTINATGIDTEVIENMEYQAIRHATYGHTLSICRFDESPSTFAPSASPSGSPSASPSGA